VVRIDLVCVQFAVRIGGVDAGECERTTLLRRGKSEK
jgi:hypothetical protein